MIHIASYSGRKGKSFEYYVAKKMGLNRNPLSGANNVNEDGTRRSGDIIHPKIEIECKHYKKVGIFTWWDKLKEDQSKAGKPYKVLIVRQDGEKGKHIDAVAIIELDEYIRLKKEVGEL